MSVLSDRGFVIKPTKARPAGEHVPGRRHHINRDDQAHACLSKLGR